MKNGKVTDKAGLSDADIMHLNFSKDFDKLDMSAGCKLNDASDRWICGWLTDSTRAACIQLSFQ